MTMRRTTAFLIFALSLSPTAFAATSKPVYQWVSASEYYMILPAAQDLRISGAGQIVLSPGDWDFGP